MYNNTGRKVVRTIFKIVNISIITIFAIMAIITLAFNVVRFACMQDSDCDYSKVLGYYMVPVNTSNWSKFYDVNSVIFVRPEEIQTEYMDKADADSPFDNILFLKKSGEDEHNYTLCDALKVTKTDGSIMYYIDKFAEGEYVVLGEVENSVPLLGICANFIYLIILVSLIICYFLILIIFSNTKFGYKIIFENRLYKKTKQMQKLHILSTNKIKREAKLKTTEDLVNDEISFILMDKDMQNIDREILQKTVANAICVLCEKDFATKEKRFVYLSALNLLNSYIKKDYAIESLRNNYVFKKDIPEFISIAENSNFEDIYCFYDQKLCVIKSMNMEFSFHNVKAKIDLSEDEWCGLRLQPYAQRIFNLFYEKEFLGYHFEEYRKNSKIVAILEQLQKN